MATSIKRINGCEYLYYHYYEKGRKKDAYCGSASKSESKRKALQFELEHLKDQKRDLSEKIREIESKI